MKRILIIITGNVTGVGFRWWLKSEADKRKVYGFVKNNNKNQVEAVLFGEEKNVDELLKLSWRGPASALVENISIHSYQKKKLNKSFDIL